MNQLLGLSTADWQKIQTYLSAERFWLLGLGFGLGMLVLVVTAYLLFRGIKFQFPRYNFRLDRVVWWVWGFLCVYRLFWAVFLPLHIDEAFNYVFLVSRGFFVSWAFYPGPNNHVFYTIFCTFWTFLPAKAALRIGSLLFSAVYSWLLAWYLQKRYGQKAAIFGVLLTCFGEYFTLYSVMGRGYAAQNLFILLSLFALIGKISSEKILLFCLANFFGFFTLPTHLFFYIPASIYLFFKTKIKDFLLINIFVSDLVFLAYLPILVFSSNTFFNNEWLNLKGFDNFLYYWIDALGTYYEVERLGFLLSLFILSYAVYFSKKDELLFLYVLLATSSFLLCFLFDKQPFNRTWFWRMNLEFMVWAVFLSKKPKIGMYIVVCYAMVLFFILLNRYSKHSVYDDVEIAIDNMYRFKPKYVYSQFDIYQVFLRLKYIVEKENLLQIDTEFDSLRHYDMMILKKGNKFATDTLVFENSEVQIFKTH